MREIKFRVWDNEKKCWYAPIFKGYENKIYELLLSMSGEIVMRSASELKHQSMFPNRYVLMQYTGLKDRNGVEIYEGDVIDCPSRPNRIGYGYVIDNLPEFYYDILDLAIVGDDIEVVGNVHESKEE